jgi:hypothetical protein
MRGSPETAPEGKRKSLPDRGHFTESRLQGNGYDETPQPCCRCTWEPAYEPSSQSELTEWVDAASDGSASEQRQAFEMFCGLISPARGLRRRSIAYQHCEDPYVSRKTRLRELPPPPCRRPQCTYPPPFPINSFLRDAGAQSISQHSATNGSALRQ